MAFRIHDSVVRGEIDNRVKGIVRGRLWLEGRAEPIALELQGNAHPDLAGCRLTFTNPLPRIVDPDLNSLSTLQQGTVGDLTASRKVRVFNVPIAEALAMLERKQKPPEHIANCLYLEWFSNADGRVVIESADYELTLSAPEWRLSPEEDEQRAQDAAAGMDAFLHRLDETIEMHRRAQKDPEAPWDEHDYERLLRESDARTDKYMELLDKYGHTDEALERIEQEMGWDDNDDISDAESIAAAEEMEAISEAVADARQPEPDPLREGVDWIRTPGGDLRHPLQNRCFQSALNFRRAAQEAGMALSAHHDLDRFLFEFQITGAKLAGALNSVARGQPPADPAFTVACLKRALDHLHQSQAGLESLAAKRLLPDPLVADARRELFQIREAILNLMDEFRGRS